jgi:hypothetical protein
MRYRPIAFLVSVTLAILLAPRAALEAGGKQDPDDKLAFLERFAGEWAVDGKWASGDRLQARGVYTWSLGKKILVTKTFVKDGDKEYQRYEGIMAWHSEKKCLYQISFAFDGAITETLVEVKDKDTLHVGWGSLPGAKASKVRQTIRFLDDDRFQWIVALQKGEEWTPIIDATWKRKGK